jgi:mycothiol synthase
MRVARHTTFDGHAVRQLSELTDRARAADGQAPFSDDLRQAAISGETDVVLVASSDEPQERGVVGVAFVARQGDSRAAELVIDPGQRGRGHGAALLAELLANVKGELWVWSHGDHPAARALAERHGLERARELLQLRRPAHLPVPETEAPPGVTVRTFRPGQDEEAWVEVNAAAFSWHPEQGSRTVDALRAAQTEPWFDPAGFFIAEAGDDVVGFHWTKVHPPTPDSPGASALGEVYVLGVAPHAHGSGIGRHLTAVGLRHLAGKPEIREVMLYVEGDNTAALRVYERLGFARHTVDVAYLRR